MTDRIKVAWMVPFLAAATIQLAAVWYYREDSAVRSLATIEAYVLAFLTVLVLEGRGGFDVFTPRWTIRAPAWLARARAGARRIRERGMLPAIGLLLLSGGIVASAETASYLLRSAAGEPPRMAALMAAFVGFQLLLPLLQWVIGAMLTALVLVLVEAEADLRFVLTLSAYAYAPLPLVTAALLGYQFIWVPDAVGGTDPRVWIPSMMALKLVEVWVVIAIARGLAIPVEGRAPRSAVLCVTIAAVPYALVSVATFASWYLFARGA